MADEPAASTSTSPPAQLPTKGRIINGKFSFSSFLQSDFLLLFFFISSFKKNNNWITMPAAAAAT